MPLSPEMQEQFEKMEWTTKRDTRVPDDPRKHLTGILGIDPMSPYTKPRSVTQFTDIADVINRKQYTAYYPQTYAPVSNYFIEYNIQPYFNPGSGEDYARGAITIAGMIELVANELPLKIERDQDLDEIIKLAQAYLDSISEIRDPHYKQYAKRTQHFVAVMTEARDKMLVRNGQTLPNSPSILDIIKRLVK